MINKTELVKKVDVKGTLLAISVGKSKTIKTRDIKASSIRSAVRRLNKDIPFSFEATEEGLVDAVKVTRFK